MVKTELQTIANMSNFLVALFSSLLRSALLIKITGC